MHKVVHISLPLSNSGGAAIACRRLNAAMLLAKIDSSVITREALALFDRQSTVVVRIIRKLLFFIKWKISQFRYRKYKISCAFSKCVGGKSIVVHPAIQQADVVYLHWFNGDIVSIEAIGKLLDSGKQVVWFCHDMWPLTGGCGHSFDCDKYCEHCMACPMLYSTRKYDLSYTVFERKLRAFSHRKNLTIVSPSVWLANCARKSRLFGDNRIECIPNIVDTEIFRPIAQNIARDILGLPKDRRLVLFGCDLGIININKGWRYLADALKQLDLSHVDLVVFGQERDDSIADMPSTTVHFLGRLNDERTSLALAYSAADVFVSPSIAESFGLTLCEASACETPVVCFDIGGTSDIVLHKKTGYRAKYKDSEDLAHGISWVLEHPDYSTIAKNARRHVVQLASAEVVIGKHIHLVEELLNP